jgi:lipopolysaccharide/colanic/teichoic acid biosynthesis glycosyltransferase
MMVKRGFDAVVALLGLIVSCVITIPVAVAIWLQDFKSPFYLGPRVARGGGTFKIVKLRSMIVRADKTGVDSTAANDPRITSVGRFVRAYKLDELTQLWNVLWGEMSLVGPRPQVRRDAELYTAEEQRLLTVRPGITDFSSIVFADEGDILKDMSDPDIAYNQLIRPWKSRLGLFYVDHSSLWLDLRLIWLTIVAVVSRQTALSGVNRVLRRLGASEDLARIALREGTLTPRPPPGSSEIVVSRGGA